ncbi:MAG TPA: thioredoxin TrxC [Steroidobacteraceae bacterium]|nr:thioredoxin TrxC [Steroidobacteraceae bacterium]
MTHTTSSEHHAGHTHIVCEHCDSVVRIPTTRLEQSPQCPQCHKPLFSGHPVALTAANFDKHVERNDVPVVIDIWAPWCGPCLAMAPHFAEAAKRLEPQWRFAKLNSDEEPQIASRLGIRSIPTLIVYHQGRELARQSGLMDANRLTQWLNGLHIHRAA